MLDYVLASVTRFVTIQQSCFADLKFLISVMLFSSIFDVACMILFAFSHVTLSRTYLDKVEPSFLNHMASTASDNESSLTKCV